MNLQPSFTELENDQLLQVDGGWTWFGVVAAVLTVAAGVDAVVTTYEGIKDGWNDTR